MTKWKNMIKMRINLMKNQMLTQEEILTFNFQI